MDREERPDVDSIYMGAVQAMTGHGGWPLNVFTDPEGVPFYGGTYFPPEPRHGMPSFRQVLEGVAEAWRTRRDEIRAAAPRTIEGLSAASRVRASEERAVARPCSTRPSATSPRSSTPTSAASAARPSSRRPRRSSS